jgi:phosphoglycerol transferase MdoB-like AlkP superfamily enzyme
MNITSPGSRRRGRASRAPGRTRFPVSRHPPWIVAHAIASVRAPQFARSHRRRSDLAEHGGDNPGDRDVPILVYAPGTVKPASNGHWTETTQVAPTILQLLGLDPNSLQAVQQEGTQVLPGLG